MKLQKALLTFSLLFGLTANTQAITVIYTDLTSFNANLGGAVLASDGFEDIVNNSPNVLDRGAYTLTTDNDIDRSTSVFSEGTQSLVIQEDTDAFALFSFNTPVFEFAIDILDAIDNGTNGGSLLVAIDGVETTFFTTAVDLANANQLFLGILSDTGFSTVRVRGSTGGSDDIIRLDNLRFSAVPAPAPAVVWLLGSGLIALVGFTRKRHV